MNDLHVHLTAVEGSFLTPSFEHATVTDAMRYGVISCPADTTVAMAARTMVTNHVHCIVVTGLADQRPWGLLEADDVMSAARDATDRHAGWLVKEPAIAVTPDQRLDLAADLLARQSASHLPVVVAWGRGAAGRF